MKVRAKDAMRYYCRSCNKEMPRDEEKSDKEHIVYKSKCNCGGGGGKLKFIS